MLKKIDKEINVFTDNIKEIEGCDKLLDYMNTDFFSSIKLLILASKTFSLYGRLMLFFIIASTGLFMSSFIDVIAISSTLLAGITLFIFVLTLIYISHNKNVLTLSIEKSKSVKQEVEKNQEN